MINFLWSCSPTVNTKVIKDYASLDYQSDIEVWILDKNVPENAEFIGTAKVGDSGFTTNCGFETLFYKAKQESLNAGGNAMQIIKHRPPNPISECHSLKVKIFRVKGSLEKEEKRQKGIITIDNSATLYFYWHQRGLTIPLGHTSIYLDDKKICKIGLGEVKTVKVNQFGTHQLIGKGGLERNGQALSINIESGKQYYINVYPSETQETKNIREGYGAPLPIFQIQKPSIGKIAYKVIKYKDKL